MDDVKRGEPSESGRFNLPLMAEKRLPTPVPSTDDLIQWRHQAFYPRIPRLSLELTSRCNLKCPYCANVVLTRAKGYIAWELLEKIVDECSREGLDLAWLHGTGEPLLWDRLEEAVQLIRSKNAGQGSFATNATLLSPKRSRSLLDAGLPCIYFSLDSLDPVIYRNTRGANLEKVIANIKNFIALAPPTFQITIALMEHKDQVLSDREIELFFETFGRRPNVQLNKVVAGLMPNSPSDFRTAATKTPTCGAPKSFLFITQEGQAALCCADQHAVHVLGDVNRQSIRAIWYDPKNQEDFRNIFAGRAPCPELCWKHCTLEVPAHQPAAALPYGVTAPWSEAVGAVRRLVSLDRVEEARELVFLLKERDPYSAEISALVEQYPCLKSSPSWRLFDILKADGSRCDDIAAA